MPAVTEARARVGPIRILHVISGLEVGGAETALFRLLERINRARFEAVVVSMTTKGILGARIEGLGVPVHALGMRRGMPDPRYLARLRKLIGGEGPDLVQTWMYHADLLGGLAARNAGCRRVVWGIRHSNLRLGSDRITTILTARLNAVLSRRVPARIVCCSEVSRRLHEKMGYDGRRMVVIPNGFDLAVYRPDEARRTDARRELGLGPAAKAVGMFARFHPQKDHQTFLRAAAHLRRAFPEARFVLAGDGVTPENPELMAWVRSGGLEPSVLLLGRRLDLAQLYPALDVFAISSSHGEAFSNVVGEAMACGVPCAVTDVGESREIVGEAGSVVPPARPEALAQAMARILRMSAQERKGMGGRARERIRERYDIGSVVNRYQALYEELLEQ